MENETGTGRESRPDDHEPCKGSSHASWCPNNVIVTRPGCSRGWDRRTTLRIWLDCCCPCIPLVHKIRYMYKGSHFRRVNKLRSCNPEPYRPKRDNLKHQVLGSFKRWGDSRAQLSEINAQSRLLQLPAEIRIMIFEMLLEVKDIHILWRNGKNIGAWYEEPEEGEPKSCACRRERRIDIMSALLTCRALSTSLTTHLYTTTTFHFHAPQTLLYFSTSLPRTSLSLIRTLHISTPSPSVCDDRAHPLNHNRITSLPDAYSSHNSFTRPLHWMPRSLRREHKHRDNVVGLPQFLADEHRSRTRVSRSTNMPSLWGAACAGVRKMSGLREVEVQVSMWAFRDGHVRRGEIERFVLGGLAIMREGKGEKEGGVRIVLEADWDVWVVWARDVGVEVRERAGK
ncbi:hypothetical protein EJ04DRAFT_575156 [Polyplosphaeria fusca]|uniref:DUF7730 domain-containing protein n=1 Tax=Polyplosphaeria fusca TaxID=682080 RepID=A0A9P4R254_9PLEO|nr:hypothetical protein EJ04DRAFT_575156 [Polyplosphaeria fusca]